MSLVAAMCALWLPIAAADEARIVWRAPSSCPSAAALDARVAELAAAHGHDASLRAVADVRGDAVGGYTLVLELWHAGEHVVRTLHASRCGRVLELAASLIAMASLPSAPLGAGEQPSDSTVASGGAAPAHAASGTTAGGAARVESGAGTSSPALERGPTRAAHAAPAPLRANGRATPDPVLQHAEPAAQAAQASSGAERLWQRLHPRLAARGGVWSLGLPGPQAFVGGALGAGGERLYAELRVDVALARSERLAGGGTAEFRSTGYTAAACRDLVLGVRLTPCAELSLWRSLGRASGLDVASAPALWWLGAGLGLGFGLRLLGPLELTGALAASLPISQRPRFAVEGAGDVAVARRLAGRAELGLGARW